MNHIRTCHPRSLQSRGRSVERRCLPEGDARTFFSHITLEASNINRRDRRSPRPWTAGSIMAEPWTLIEATLVGSSTCKVVRSVRERPERLRGN